ncbi:MAG: metal ABC transporter ATP-binding protein [Candidatus Thermoplasmatota archaeon]|nr:metal ABC transporter ATP-binding protein [Candidatus Thermoplasmatota archaeon]
MGTRTPSPYLSVAHLSVQREGEVILEDVSFEVPKGQVLAVVGPNGGGKTTLLRALLGRVPHQGEVRWAEPVRIGYVPQKLVETDIPLSVEELLAMKCPGDYARCLSSVGLDPSLLPKSIGVLSGGEIQRVLIAWAVVDSPQVMLFDEPTSNTDVGSEEVIFHTLRSVQKELQATMLLVTHDVHSVHHFADEVLVLNRRVIFQGPPRQLLADHRLFREAFQMSPEEEGHLVHGGKNP